MRKRNNNTNEKRPKISWAAVKKASRIFHFLKPYRGKFLVGMLFLLLSSATSMLFPGLMGKLVDANSTEGVNQEGLLNFDNINSVAIILFAVFLTQAIFSFFRIILFASVTESMLATLRQHTYNHLIRLPMEFFSKKRVGDLNSRISADVSVLQETFTTTLAEFIRQILTIIGGIVLLTFYSYKLTLMMLAVLPVMMVAAVIFGKFIKNLSKKTQSQIADSNVIVEETLTGIVNVKSFVNELFESIRYKNSTNEIKKIALKAASWRGAFASFIIVCMFGAIVLVIWYGVHLKAEGEISIGDLFSFILYSVFVGASFGGIADLFTQIQKAIGATENLFEILDESTEKISLEPQETGKTLHGNVAFQKVSFAYPTRKEVQVLNDVSFVVNSGEKLAIVGPSGAGKSTLVQLLLQFYQPDSGQLLFDGEAANNFELTDIRKHMAFVPQEVLLFGGTIKENIAYGNPDASEEEIQEAARKANAHEFIMQFPDKYDTVVGERGIQLSGGQRQRIAIARAVLKNPTILILDEATSSLDSESEKLVQDALLKLMEGRTSFVIAHRLSTIKDADKILVLEKGRVKEMGSHSELLADEEGLYKHLTALQTELA